MDANQRPISTQLENRSGRAGRVQDRIDEGVVVIGDPAAKDQLAVHDRRGAFLVRQIVQHALGMYDLGSRLVERRRLDRLLDDDKEHP